jgi:mono/diheme cytochrome c family protein
MNAKTFTRLAPAILAGALVLASAEPARAQPESQSMESGSQLYVTYCASCHGPNAHGNGSIAIFLRVAPADLTQIAKRNNGVFDRERVYRIIDGRQPVKPHGRAEKSEMPVWGDAFGKSATTGGDETVVSAKIRALVQYLESIQERSAK